jgi:hypothetical protein
VGQIVGAVLPRQFNEAMIPIKDHKELLQYISAEELHESYGGLNK